MSAPKNPSRDQMLDENLQRIARSISLPAAPPPERIHAWKNAAIEPWTDVRVPQKRHRLFRLWPLFTGAAAAAGIVLAVFVILASPRPVSAETIFNSLRAVLSGPVSITLDIGFEGVTLSGRIVKDVDASGASRSYSEIHAVLKSDNPEWSDLESVTVVNDAADQSWMFSRGSGGCGPQGRGPDGRYHVTPAELCYIGRLPEFVRAKALHLDGVPSVGFGKDGSAVSYRFDGPERRYLCSLMELTEGIANSTNLDDLIERVKSAACDVRVEAAGRGWRLRASAYQPSALFPELDLSLPDADLASILDRFTHQIEFVGSLALEGRSLYFQNSGDELLQKLHIAVDTSDLYRLAQECEVAEEFAEKVRPRAREVMILPGSHGGTAVRISGYDWQLDTSARDRLRQIGTEIVPGIELLIDYDGQSGSVRWAEFRNLTPAGGTIRLQPGAIELDPAVLDPKHWITDATEIYE